MCRSIEGDIFALAVLCRYLCRIYWREGFILDYPDLPPRLQKKVTTDQHVEMAIRLGEIVLPLEPAEARITYEPFDPLVDEEQERARRIPGYQQQIERMDRLFGHETDPACRLGPNSRAIWCVGRNVDRRFGGAGEAAKALHLRIKAIRLAARESLRGGPAGRTGGYSFRYIAGDLQPIQRKCLRPVTCCTEGWTEPTLTAAAKRAGISIAMLHKALAGNGWAGISSGHPRQYEYADQPKNPDGQLLMPFLRANYRRSTASSVLLTGSRSERAA